MKIHFVTESKKQSWVLRPLARALQTRIPGATLSTYPMPGADWNIFFNYALWQGTDKKTACLFTHRESRGPLREVFDRVALKCDLCIAMSLNTLKLLPEGKSFYLETYPTDPRYYKTLKIGVCGRRYKSGRKRMWLAEKVNDLPGVEVWITDGKIPQEEMPSFYEKIDYLLVTSDNEGGPQPVLEALATGTPVIAPDVGYCWQYPCFKFETEEELLKLVRNLTVPRDGWNRSAKILREKLECL